MRTNDEQLLRDMRKKNEKHKRVNSYKAKYMKTDGQYEEVTFHQGYDHSTDVYNPFFVRVYDSSGSYIHSGSSSTIEGAYNALIMSLIQYKGIAETQRNEANAKLSKIMGIIVEDEEEDYDDRF